jgi:hypothetical protein
MCQLNRIWNRWQIRFCYRGFINQSEMLFESSEMVEALRTRFFVHLWLYASGETTLEDQQALSIISALANGHSPITGELLDDQSVVHNGDVIRALYVAVRALENTNRSKRASRSRLPENAGKPWSDEEDRLLLEKFDEGMRPAELAPLFQRTIPGIAARLERHGRLDAGTWRSGRAGARVQVDAS